MKIDSGSDGSVHFLVTMKLLKFIGIDYRLEDEQEREMLNQVNALLTHSLTHSLDDGLIFSIAQYENHTNTDYNNTPVGSIECVSSVFN